MLRMGYLINFTGCTVLWCSRLQTEIYLSTTKAEYITLSQEMREVIHFMTLMKKVYFIIDINLLGPEIFCK